MITCKLKAENTPHLDDPSPRMILALGSCSFHVNWLLIYNCLKLSTFVAITRELNTNLYVVNINFWSFIAKITKAFHCTILKKGKF